MYDSEKIRAAAEAVIKERDSDGSYTEYFAACDSYDAEATPETVLALLDEIERLRKDKERLDSGVIIFRTYDSMGYDCVTESRGLDLRAMIDGAMELRDHDAARTQGGDA